MTKLTFTLALLLAGLMVFGTTAIGVSITRLNHQISEYESRLAQLKGDVQMNNDMFWRLWMQIRNMSEQS